MKIFLIVYLVSMAVMVLIAFTDKEVKKDKGVKYNGKNANQVKPSGRTRCLVLAVVPAFNTIFIVLYLYDRLMDLKDAIKKGKYTRL